MNPVSEIKDLIKGPIVVVYKHSRYSYILQSGQKEEKKILTKINDPYVKNLIRAHEDNLKCIDNIENILKKFGVKYKILCRSDLKAKQILNGIIISVGGDGTLLDVSHHVKNAPILGVNSDPKSSVGALCAAKINNFQNIMQSIFSGDLIPIEVNRLKVKSDRTTVDMMILNDILVSHKNPASMSRFSICRGDKSSEIQSSGVWVSSAAGSSGAIYSAGAQALDINSFDLLFKVREPYFQSNKDPMLLAGQLSPGQELKITPLMIGHRAYFDGPHKYLNLGFMESIRIRNHEYSLHLFAGPHLSDNRRRIVKERRQLRNLVLTNSKKGKNYA